MPGSAVDLLLVRGAPGVGKTSACRKLRKAIPDGAIIEVDALRGMIAGVRWVDTEHHQVALDHARLLIRSFLDKGFRPVVLIDTFSRGKLMGFTSGLDVAYRVASLFAEREVLEQRVLGRPENEFRDLAACHTLNDEVAVNRYAHETLVDVTRMRPSEVASELLAVIEGQHR